MINTSDRLQIEAVLERVLISSEFIASVKLGTLLSYLVNETLDGRAERLKAFAIAQIVYGRDKNFDPQTNSLVRVEALRLRRALERYALNEGATDQLVIIIPRGGYIPKFKLRDAVSAVDGKRAPKFIPANIGIKGVIALVSCLAMAAVAVKIFTNFSAPSARSTQTASKLHTTLIFPPLKPMTDRPQLQEFGNRLIRQVSAVVSRFENPVVIDGGAEPADYEFRSDFTLQSPQEASLVARIVHSASNSVIWSEAFINIPVNEPAALSETAARIGTMIARRNGVVFSDVLQRANGNTDAPTGIECVLLGYNAVTKSASQGFVAARNCLQREIVAHPTYTSAYCALSEVLTGAYLFGDASGDDETRRQAVALAQQAVELAPQSGRARAQLFWAQFLVQRFEDAMETAELALKLNPYPPDVLRRVGVAYTLRGDMDRGQGLFRQALARSPDVPGSAEFSLFLIARVNGDHVEARRHATRPTAVLFPLGQVARIILAGDDNDAAGAREGIASLQNDFPKFASDLKSSFERYGMAPHIRDRLLAGVGVAQLLAAQ